MELRLPVLYKTNENVYSRAEIKKPSGKAISDVTEARKQGNAYLQMRLFVSSCVVQFISETNVVTDAVAISRMCALMSNKNLEYLSQEIMVFYYNGNDFVDGYYECPRCKEPKICEKRIVDGVELNTRDKISDLEIVFMENPEENFFTVDFTIPVQIDGKKESIEVQSVGLILPSTEIYIQAINEVGETNDTKLQFSVYAKSITHVNGESVDKDWIKNYGVKLFENCKEVYTDIDVAITGYINKYGIQPGLTKHCTKCGKEWEAYLDSSNYFGSVLR